MPTSKYWKSQITEARRQRDQLVPSWKENVRFRLNKHSRVSDTSSDSEREQSRYAVPIDASFTKAKIAALFSQVPAVAVTAKDPQWQPAAPAFAKELNETLQTAKVDRAMEECLADVINAAGVAAVKVGYQATFKEVEVPAQDLSLVPPEMQLAMLQSGQVKMEKVKQPVDERYYVERITPANLLWPANFKGSDFDEAAWVGMERQISVAQAKREFGLTKEQIEEVKGAGKLESLSDDDEHSSDDDKLVTFSELFYHSADFNSDELYFDKIRRIVFIEGLEDAVVDEDLQWQRWDEQTGSYIGVCKYPIRVLTLKYITDQAIPPSDSEVGRPQVLETMRSRAQIIQQRDHSRPMRWYDTNRADSQVMDLINRGEWQTFIPTQGDGSRVIGEVASKAYPAENWDFDRVIRSDLQEAWSLGANQIGQFATGERSASEASIVQQNYNTGLGFERAKVAKFFVSIAEVLTGLLQLYKDRPEELIGGQQSLQAIHNLPVNAKVALSIKPDSTVLLDASAKIDRLMKTLNLVGKSGYVNVEPLIAEIISLSGLDPAQVMTKPQPPAPEQPNFSYRFSGKEDLTNPIVIAMLIKEGKAPGPQEIQKAKMLLEDAYTMQPPAPALPQGGGMQGQMPGMGEMGDMQQEPNPVGRPPLASAPPEDWGPMPRVSKRIDEMGG